MMTNKMTYHANGKLLLSGEYFVLDGAKALAVPTRYGQSLSIKATEAQQIVWKSYNADKSCWFEGVFQLRGFQYQKGNDEAVGERLTQILQACQSLNPDFLADSTGLIAETHLEFPKNWGLGTSSTLIYMVAKWAGVNPFELLAMTFGGSGYDIACAGINQGITYQIVNQTAVYSRNGFYPPFAQNLYFVYLGKKQNSREGIAHYKAKVKDAPELIEEISEITNQMIACQTLEAFEQLIAQHEAIVSNALQFARAKDLYFKDYWGEIKSLGAWGGDFVMATSSQSSKLTRAYFHDLGYATALTYGEMIK